MTGGLGACWPIRALIALLSLALLPAALAETLPDVRAIRFAGAGEITRVIVESDVELSGRVSLALRDDAPELWVSLPVVRWSLDGETRSAGTGTGSARVVSFAYGADGPAASKLVLSLDGPARVMRELNLPPSPGSPHWRFILDLEGESDKAFARRAKADMRSAARKAAPVEAQEASAPAPAASPGPMELLRAGARRYVVVIDPGHGGRDPGAVAPSGLMEKDVNLKTSLLISEALSRSPRFEVHLTREDDTYLALEERVERARDWGADLFISVHADAAESKEAKGASVYTLSESGSRRSKALADREDWVIPLGAEEGTDGAVVAILEDLVERETKTQSGVFATALVEALGVTGPMLRNSHRSAGFVVLFAPDVPAVLVELGFLTNPDDVRRLSSHEGRKQAAEAIASAVTAYFADRDRRRTDG